MDFPNEILFLLGFVGFVTILTILNAIASRYERERKVHDLRIRVMHLRNEYAEKVRKMQESLATSAEVILPDEVIGDVAGSIASPETTRRAA